MECKLKEVFVAFLFLVYVLCGSVKSESQSNGKSMNETPHQLQRTARNLNILRCNDMAESFGMCHLLPTNLNCGWCSSSNTCEVEDQCKTEDTLDWLNRMQTCPNPEIHSFTPKSGPWEGGTNITITGINLGKNFSDIYEGVKIAGIDCVPYKELYLASRQIVCKVYGPGTYAYRTGKVVVEVQDFRGESREDFEFMDPIVYDFEPKFGPMSGGTRIHIRGNCLNAGSFIRASIDGNRCEILSTDKKEAFCRTTASTSRSKGFLKMEFDLGERELTSVQFEYVEDPIIKYATSGNHNEMIPKGIPSGGIKISVYGENFNSIQLPSMFVYYRDRMFSSACVIIKNDLMLCDSPKIEMDLKGVSPQVLVMSAELEKWQTGDFPLHLEYGFQMDDVKATQNLSITQHPFQLFPNPIYYEFNKKKYFNNETLIIDGKNLDRACKNSDVTVVIGSQICKIISLSRHQLIFKPPIDGRDDMKIVVKVGKNLEFPIGILSYNEQPAFENLGNYTLILIIVGIISLIAIIIGRRVLKKKAAENILQVNNANSGQDFEMSTRLRTEEQDAENLAENNEK